VAKGKNQLNQPVKPRDCFIHFFTGLRKRDVRICNGSFSFDKGNQDAHHKMAAEMMTG
jgi:hypothetical protein